MNIEKHSADSRGSANHGWLQVNHSFSFASYYNPDRMHFGALRVLNDDTIAPKMGFGEHPHKNMEIITIPLQGVLKHKDNMSDKWLPIVPNEVQVMSAGSGVYHSEINGSNNEYLKLFQIWIIPNEDEVTPRHDQRFFLPDERKNKLQVLVSNIEGGKEGLKIHQDAMISRIDLDEGENFEYLLKSSAHGVYLMNISGVFEVEKIQITKRDALAISDTKGFTVNVKEQSELLFIEVPMKI